MRTLLTLLLLSTLLLSQELVSTKLVGPGVYYKIYQDNSQPLFITVLEADLNNDSIMVDVGIANDKIGHGGEGTSKMVHRKSMNGEYIIGAVNGDFFGGRPLQSENNSVSSGKIIKGVSYLNRTLFGITRDNKPFTGKFKFNATIKWGTNSYNVGSYNRLAKLESGLFDYHSGNIFRVDSDYTAYLMTKLCDNNYVVDGVLKENSEINLKKNQLVWRVFSSYSADIVLNTGDKLSVDFTLEDAPENIYAMIGGLPYLVKDGKRPETYIGVEGLTSERFISYNPRTAIGFDKSENKLYLVAVDGRNKDVSIGISLYDLADFLISLGCDDALNFDGGGSTTMTVRDSIVNHPSDKTGERSTHNSLYIKTKGNITKEPVSFSFNEKNINAPSANKLELQYTLRDKWGCKIVDKNVKPIFYSKNKFVRVKKDTVVAKRDEEAEIIGIYKTLRDTMKVKFLPGIN